MSGATASFTETVFVRLLGEGVDVWRPVAATALAGGLFQLGGDPVPAGETWEFAPGSVVRTAARDAADGVVQVARAATPTLVRRAS